MGDRSCVRADGRSDEPRCDAVSATFTVRRSNVRLRLKEDKVGPFEVIPFDKSEEWLCLTTTRGSACKYVNVSQQQRSCNGV